MSLGFILVVLGAGLATILGGIGSILGVQCAGKAAAGVTAEQPELFGKLIVLQILPGTQGLYGFLVTVIVLGNFGLFDGSYGAITNEGGWAVFGACLPVAISGLVSGYYQGKVAAAAILMTAKQQDSVGKGITMTVLVELYAIISLIVSILLVLAIKF